jgi:molybdopterin synthase catalytic subunit
VDTIRLVNVAFAPDRELDYFVTGLWDAGAVASFVGIARPTTAAGDPLELLFVDHHPRLTRRSLETVAAAARDRFDITAIRLIHRYGDILPSEPIVFVAAAAEHRRQAFDAVDFIMDGLKSITFFWKREDGSRGSAWIEPTAADLRSLMRWS